MQFQDETFDDSFIWNLFFFFQMAYTNTILHKQSNHFVTVTILPTIISPHYSTSQDVFHWDTGDESQILSEADMYLSRKHLISEMCMVSLMVVSLLRTSRSPLFSVLSLTITVKRTPISSYLQHKENFLSTLISSWKFYYKITQYCIENVDRVSYLVCKFSRDNDIVSKYPGHVEIPTSRNSWSKPSQTFWKTVVLGSVHIKWCTNL